MVYTTIPFGVLLSAAAQIVPATSSGSSCKCIPSDNCWPTQAEWTALNSSIHGHLIQGRPPASVCYPSEPNYDAAACDDVLEAWKSSAWHAADPVSVDGPDPNHGCYPTYQNGTDTLGNTLAREQGCSSWNYPAYIVNASAEEYIQAGVRFASKHNLRLNVKGTGHGGQHSQTPGSLSIWTHHLQDIESIENFQPAGSKNNSTSSSHRLAMRFGAGVQDRTAFEAAAEHDAVVVGGTDSTVGLAGWATGGGHGYLTGEYGQGADNILEARIVIPCGDVVVANEVQNSDLFWSIRGGGHALAGVISSLTMKAYPSPATTFWALSVSHNNGSSVSEWWDIVAEILSGLPALKDAGLTGYMTLGGPPFTFTNAGFAHNAANESIEAAIAPLVSWLDQHNATVTSTSTLISKQKWIDIYHMFNLTLGAGGGFGASTSRLLPASSLTEDKAASAKMLARISTRDLADSSDISNPDISGTWTLSPVREDSALSSAWRNALVHLRIAKSWTAKTSAAEAERVTKYMTEDTGYALRQLAPDAGAYFNEADPNEPNWQYSLFGDNYARLRAVKNKYDPEGLQWCEHCVGSEEWVQGNMGKLCRRDWVESA